MEARVTLPPTFPSPVGIPPAEQAVDPLPVSEEKEGR
jgi:hypothetical protein